MSCLSINKALNFKIHDICRDATKGQVDLFINRLVPYINRLDYVFLILNIEHN